MNTIEVTYSDGEHKVFDAKEFPNIKAIKKHDERNVKRVQHRQYHMSLNECEFNDDGVKHGVEKQYYRNGTEKTIKWEKHWINGFLTRIIRFYYLDHEFWGVPEYECNYDEPSEVSCGLHVFNAYPLVGSEHLHDMKLHKNGFEKYFYPNRTTRKVYDWSRGQLQSKRSYDEDGNITKDMDLRTSPFKIHYYDQPGCEEPRVVYLNVLKKQ